MFNEEDFENVPKLESTIPDGLMDGTAYVQVLSSISDKVLALDHNEMNQRIVVMMGIVNECYDEGQEDISMDRVMNVIIALTFKLLMAINLSQEMNSEFKNVYEKEIRNVIAGMEQVQKAVPYWGSITND
jgi:hypothetical protein